MGIFDSVFGKKERTIREKKELPWITLESLSQLDEIKEKSKERTQVIFKHSTTCGISAMVLNMFTNNYDLDLDCDLYFLTIQMNRDISSEVSSVFGVRHESPQLLVVKNGEVNFHTSHGGISDSDLKNFI